MARFYVLSVSFLEYYFVHFCRHERLISLWIRIRLLENWAALCVFVSCFEVEEWILNENSPMWFLWTAGRVTFEPAYDALILHMSHQQTLGCFYTCLCALASSLYSQDVDSNRWYKRSVCVCACFFWQFLLALACSGSVDYVPCVIGREISAEAACISNDSVGGGLII